MKKTKLFTLLGGICLVLILAALPFMAACAAPAPAPAPTPTPTPTPTPLPPAEPVVLKAVSWMATHLDGPRFLGIYADRVTERANGELIIQWIGGPEVMSMRELPDAVRKGVIDIASNLLSFHQALVPEVNAIGVSEYTLAEERERGFFDLMVELHQEKANMRYLGKLQDNLPLYMYVNVKVETPEDLVGLKVEAIGLFNEFFKNLGISPVSMNQAEVYTALERGLLQGHTNPHSTVLGLGLYEVEKYWIEPPMWDSQHGLLMNLDAWNRLPKHLQDLMTNVMIELEPEISTFWAENERKAGEELIARGMSPIIFSPEDTKRFRDIGYDGQWAVVKEKVSPEMYTKLRELLMK